MPIEHSASKAAFSRNVSTEMHHGKPQKVALAIAYRTKRDAMKKKRKTTKKATAAKTSSGRKMIRITSNPYSAY